MSPVDITYPEIFLRLALATILGGIIGYERESSYHNAGLRTHMLVAVSAALIGCGSILMFNQYHHLTTRMDPLRAGAQVISGIGFLGAGAILKHGSSVRGLTTAASLWGIAAVGLFTGLGAVVPSIMTTGIIFLGLTLTRYSHYLGRKKGLLAVEIYAHDKIGQLGEIGNRLSEFGANVRNINIETLENEEIIYHLLISMSNSRSVELIDGLSSEIRQIPGVYKINID